MTGNAGFDPLTRIGTAAPGVVVQREVIDAIEIAFVADGSTGLSKAQALAAIMVPPPSALVTTHAYLPTKGVTFPVTPPPYPTGLPRFADSNPASDGWCIDDPTTVPQ